MRMDEDGLTKAVARLETAAEVQDGNARQAHFKEIVMNILHEHAKAFGEEVQAIKIRDARFDAVESVLIEMLNAEHAEEIPKAVAELQARVAELEQQV